MAVTATTIFLQTPHDPAAKKASVKTVKHDCSVAGTTIFTGSTNGSYFTGFSSLMADAGTTDSQVLIIYNDGANRVLIGQVPVQQTVPTTTTPTWRGSWYCDRMFIPNGDTIEVGITAGNANIYCTLAAGCGHL